MKRILFAEWMKVPFLPGTEVEVKLVLESSVAGYVTMVDDCGCVKLLALQDGPVSSLDQIRAVVVGRKLPERPPILTLAD